MSIPQGTAYKFFFVGVDANSPTSRLASVPWVTGDVMITKPDGTPTASTNLPVDRGGGRYQLDLTAAETGIGLSTGQVGEILLDIAHVGGGFSIIPLLGVTLEVSAVATPSSPPTADAIAAAVDAILADDFAALPTAGSIATAVGAPTANQVRDAVWAQLSDGSPVLQRLTAAIALLLNKAQLPGEEGGAIVVRDAADTKDRIVAAITSGGARTVTTVDGT